MTNYLQRPRAPSAAVKDPLDVYSVDFCHHDESCLFDSTIYSANLPLDMCVAKIYVRGGTGGEGAASFRVMAKKQRGKPNGGSGGKGGDVTLVRLSLGPIRIHLHLVSYLITEAIN